MTTRAKVIEIQPDGTSRELPRIQLTQSSGTSTSTYDEAFIENLVMKHPGVLPVEELDSAYSNPVPVCTQLSTDAGYLDALLITPTGRLVIVEAKLWRNPEAKRKVIAQLLDYASELARWTYEDLERQIRRRRGEHKATLHEMVCGDGKVSDESDFVDEVVRSLRLGRFLLLIVGDGIREGLGGISEFLERHTTLDFTFGLVELGIYDGGGSRRLVHPRVLARSVTLRRQVLRVEAESASIADEDEDSESPQRELDTRELALLSFWQRLEERLTFDDPNQETIRPSTRGNVSLRLPSPRAWITLYFEKASGTQGLFLTFNVGEPGDSFWERLESERDVIEPELPEGTDWWSTGERHRIRLKRDAADIFSDAGIEDGIEWFTRYANVFVNVFRPRIARYLEEL
jgi:hypothetical protein